MEADLRLSPLRSRKGAATCSPGFPVPSARRGLTALFGMGRGGTPALLPPFPFIFTSFLYPFLIPSSFVFLLPLSSFLSRAFARTYNVKRQFHAGSRAPPPPLRGCGILKQYAFPGKLRAISTARLCRRRLYTCGLSTSSSPTALREILSWGGLRA